MSKVDLGTLSNHAVHLRNRSISVRLVMGEQIKALLEGYDSQRGLHEVLKVISESDSAKQHFEHCPSAKHVIDEILQELISVWSKKSFLEYFSDRGVKDECVSNSVEALYQALKDNESKVDVFSLLTFSESDVLSKVMYDPFSDGLLDKLDVFIERLPKVEETGFYESAFQYVAAFYVIKKVANDLEALSVSLSNDQCVGRKGASERLSRKHSDYASLFNNSRSRDFIPSSPDFIDDYYFWYFFAVHYDYDLYWTERDDSYLASVDNDNYDVDDQGGENLAALSAAAMIVESESGPKVVERDDSDEYDYSELSAAASIVESDSMGKDEQGSAFDAMGTSDRSNLGSFS